MYFIYPFSINVKKKTVLTENLVFTTYSEIDQKKWTAENTVKLLPIDEFDQSEIKIYLVLIGYSCPIKRYTNAYGLRRMYFILAVAYFKLFFGWQSLLKNFFWFMRFKNCSKVKINLAYHYC